MSIQEATEYFQRNLPAYTVSNVERTPSEEGGSDWYTCAVRCPVSATVEWRASFSEDYPNVVQDAA